MNHEDTQDILSGGRHSLLTLEVVDQSQQSGPAGQSEQPELHWDGALKRQEVKNQASQNEYEHEYEFDVSPLRDLKEAKRKKRKSIHYLENVV